MAIENLDRLVTSGKGDERFREMFGAIMSRLCENDFATREQVIEFKSYFMFGDKVWLLPLILCDLRYTNEVCVSV